MNNPIEYIQGVTALKADLLKKELGIFRFQDLLEHYPLRHLDKTRLDKIGQLNASNEYAQVAGKVTDINIMGEKRSKRL
ncbi:MAG TPA: ATP-dependent DNA helicase RecG, partial [Ferruginibacter sp.]|nr:ATP-dependent DNA helicase RecG [Ferruginibacter sp.]